MTDRFGIIVVGDEILGARRRDRHFDNLGGLLQREQTEVRVVFGDPIEVAGEVRWRRNGGDPALGMHFSFPGSVERRRMRELIAGIRDAIAGSTEMPVTLLASRSWSTSR